MTGRTILILIGVAVLLVAFAAVGPATLVHFDCRCAIRVTGRLTEGDGQSPAPRAWVMSLPSRVEAESVDDARWHRRRIEEFLVGLEAERMDGGVPYLPFHAPQDAGGCYAKSDGTFAFDLTVAWSYNEVFGITWGARRPPARYGIAALAIEIEGRAPVILDIPTGTWTEQGGEDGLWATWDLGVVEVPGRP